VASHVDTSPLQYSTHRALTAGVSVPVLTLIAGPTAHRLTQFDELGSPEQAWLDAEPRGFTSYRPLWPWADGVTSVVVGDETAAQPQSSAGGQRPGGIGQRRVEHYLCVQPVIDISREVF
jgi:hypothetical protein